MSLHVFLYSILTPVPTGAFVNSLQLRAVMVIKSLPELSPEGSRLLLSEVAKPSVPIPALRNPSPQRNHSWWPYTLNHGILHASEVRCDPSHHPCAHSPRKKTLSFLPRLTGRKPTAFLVILSLPIRLSDSYTWDQSLQPTSQSLG